MGFGVVYWGILRGRQELEMLSGLRGIEMEGFGKRYRGFGGCNKRCRRDKIDKYNDERKHGED